MISIAPQRPGYRRSHGEVLPPTSRLPEPVYRQPPDIARTGDRASDATAAGSRHRRKCGEPPVVEKGFVWLSAKSRAASSRDCPTGSAFPGIGFLRRTLGFTPPATSRASDRRPGQYRHPWASRGKKKLEKWLDNNGLADRDRAGFATGPAAAPVGNVGRPCASRTRLREMILLKSRLNTSGQCGLRSSSPMSDKKKPSWHMSTQQNPANCLAKWN